MSFSSSVKEELARTDTGSRHCRIAELAAVYLFCGVSGKEADPPFLLHAENPSLRRRVFTLLRKTFKITSCADMDADPAGNGALLKITDPQEAEKVLSAVSGPDEASVIASVCGRSCCMRAFLRGAFLAAGSVSDPEKSYHFEIVCAKDTVAQQIVLLIGRFGIEARTVERKSRYVVYVKEGTQIVNLLNIMGAHTSLMQMENVRIVKDVRGRVNRQVNCETANLTKTVNASVRELEEISLLEETGMLERLPQPLRETALLRKEHPDASLRELGELHDPPIGRSGVNHRLKKISIIASGVVNHGGNSVL